MASQDITIRTPKGESFTGYLARPAAGKGPGILVLQEIFGVNRVMRDLADGFARDGYFALVPDLFWRQQPGIQLTDKTEAEWSRAFELYQGFDEGKGIEDAKAALAELRRQPGASGKAGCVGYCLGGKLAYLMATRSDADCSAGYYGVGIENALDEAKKIKKPLLLHVALKDRFVPPEAQKKVRDALDGNSLITLHDYPGVDHAFARAGGEHYDALAAKLANERTRAFFKKHLG